MAITATKISTIATIKAKTGVTDTGKDKIKNISLRNIKTTALDEDIFEVANAVADVLAYPSQGIMREDVNQLITE